MTATHVHAAGGKGPAQPRRLPQRRRTITLNELRMGHQRIADIYGLPVNIVRDPLNGKFTAWLGQPGTSGAASGPIVETIVPQKAREGPPKNHGLKRAMLTHVLLEPKA